jgi:hypothetical protein
MHGNVDSLLCSGSSYHAIQKDIFEVPAAIEYRHHINHVAFYAVEQSPWCDDQLPVGHQPDGFQFRYDTTTVRESLKAGGCSFELVEDMLGRGGIFSRDIFHDGSYVLFGDTGKRNRVFSLRCHPTPGMTTLFSSPGQRHRPL